jgi:hypothetical protein
MRALVLQITKWDGNVHNEMMIALLPLMLLK